MADPMKVLRVDRRQAIKLASQQGVSQTVAMLRKAQSDLNKRLKKAESLRGPGADSFTAAQLQTTLRQIRLVLLELQGGMRSLIVDHGQRTAEHAAQSTLKFIKTADKKFTGVNQRLAIREASVMSRAVSGAKSSILHRLEGDKKRGPGILTRYGDTVVKRFEERLQQRFVTKKPWDDVRKELIDDSPFLQKPDWPGQPPSPKAWAERIVRTEVMNAHGFAQFEGIRAVNKAVGGGMLKILVATFDDRTGADSYAVHGQIRRPEEAFEDWYSSYQHPPNRPNDRETVVPHHMDWPIPDELEWVSDEEVSARWSELGRKGEPPMRPEMTTVPLEKIGQSG
jgi:hypothetical protein